MKTIINTIATILLFGGIVMMAGSAGDCDGKCGPGNDILTMLTLAGTGLVFFVSGVFFTMVGQND